MSKKLITAALALVALAAFALPASAAASPEVTHPTGTTMAVHPVETTCTAKPEGCLLGTNIGNTFLKTGSTVLSECTTARLTGELTKNNGTTFEGNITTATFSGTGGQDPAEAANMPECPGEILGYNTVTTNGGGIDEATVPNGTPWCMKSMTLGAFIVRGGLCTQTQRNIDFIVKSTTIGSCVYTRAAALTGTYSADSSGDAIFTLTSEGTEFTKKEGGFFCPASASLEMKFTMETDTGSKVPVYIS